MYVVMMATYVAQGKTGISCLKLKKGVGIASISTPSQQHYRATTHHTAFVSSV